MGHPSSEARGKRPLPLLVVTVAAAALLLAGVRHDLPFVPEADEPLFVVAAVRIAATGDLNPHWFGHPGATVIYPLALGYHAWYALAHHGRLFAFDPNLARAYPALAPEFVLLGRLLTITYALLCVPLAYAVGRLAFGRRQALVGAAATGTIPLLVEYAQVVRTDSAAACFALLALWRCLVLLERPRTRNQLIAGAAIGLAVASRYFMLALAPVLLAVDIVLWRRRSRSQARSRSRPAPMLLGGCAAVLGFVAASPYAVLDYHALVSDLGYEARSAQMGQVALSPAGNMWWYVGHAVPEGLTIPLVILAACGIAAAVTRRNAPAIVLLAFPITLLAGISFSALHWSRWILQLLPLLALFAAAALIDLVDIVSKRARLPLRSQAWLAVGATLVVLAPALVHTAVNDVKQARTSTRLQARQWLLENVPAGAKVGLEWWTAPLFPEDFGGFVPHRSGATGGSRPIEIEQYWRLPAAGTVAQLRAAGFDFLVVSGNSFGPILADPSVHPQEAAFYRQLFDAGPPVAEFADSRTTGGPLIRVFSLAPR